MQRPDFCANCPIRHVTVGYVPLCLGTGNELWVGEAAGEEEVKASQPFVGGAGSWLNSMLRSARIPRVAINLMNVIGCRPPGNVFPTDPKWPAAVKKFWWEETEKLRKAKKFEEYQQALGELPTKTSSREAGREGVRYCIEHHLQPVIKRQNWSRIVALGDVALQALTTRKGILLWRGSPLALRGELEPKVLPTLHPAYLMRDPDLFSVAVGDLRRRVVIPPEEYNLFPSLPDVKGFVATKFAFDFEWDMATGEISLCGLSDKYYRAMVVPFCEPFIEELRRIFECAEELVGHNIIGADSRYFERLGWKVHAKPIDTMLIQHLVQPDMAHDLGFVASVWTGKVFWKGKGEKEENETGDAVSGGAQWKTWNDPDAIPTMFGGYGGCCNTDEAFRLYNARDTDASYQQSGPLVGALRRYGLERVYEFVSVPAAYVCRDITAKGLKIDRTKVTVIRERLAEQIAELEVRLPKGLRPWEEPITKMEPAPPGAWKPKTKICKGDKIHGKHDRIDIVFNSPGNDVCIHCNKIISSGRMIEAKTIKVAATKRLAPWNSAQQVAKYAKELGCETRYHIKTGKETTDKNARRAWGREHIEFTIVDRLKHLATRRNSFAKPGLLNMDRVFFNLLVHGTAEGRLSSSGRYGGPNIQNQPKDIRAIFIPDYPGWGILSADLAQAENMLTAWLAKDHERMERLQTSGFDEHAYMAGFFFGKPYEDCKKGGPLAVLRNAGKIVNHGRNYGMGPRKLLEKLYEEGMFQYTESDVKEMIEIWKRENRRTAEWQQETIETAKRQGYVVNPFGRKRWLQSSRDYATKALAFGPASTVADMVLRMMIAVSVGAPEPTGGVCRRAANELGIRVTYEIPEPWALRIQVHDELVAIGPDENHREVASGFRAVMTQPWAELDGFSLGAEVKYSTESWGAGKEI